MDLFFESLTQGIAFLGQPGFVLIVLLGTLWGIAGGAMPGTSASLTVGVALPFTFTMAPEQAVAFVMAILVGANFGNSIPAILIGVPGTPSAILTAQEGFLLHRQGKTGLALGTMYISSLVGQGVSIIFFVALVVPLASLAYLFLPPEIFAMALLGMTAVIGLAGRSVLKGVVAGALGVAVSMIGLDPVNSTERLTFGVLELRDGLSTLALVIGLLAISELIRSTRQVYAWAPPTGRFNARFPRLSELRGTGRPLTIGTLIGCFVGLAPGASADAASFVSYQQAKASSKRPREFGRGSIEGIAANESAQQACQAGDLIPTLAVGIPGGATMVLVLAAVTLQGLVPGPLLVEQSPELLFGSVGGLLAATLFLLVIGWPLCKVVVKVATADRTLVLVGAFVLALVGVYSLQLSTFDVMVAVLAGLVGYVMIRFGYSVAAASLGVILGPQLESSLREGLLLEDGNFLHVVSRAITAIVLVLAALSLAYGVRAEIRARRVDAANRAAA
jgi:putative tricarboxylic transport membrane protein